ncbi:disease resistance protein RGA2-like isoform X2 [Quercus suber]|uniref:disease resistance protein RGA2-like isoform X2 n=1 Tax=Quercus suber TaxID=58331 RepID=UPI000CE1944D|nr:disease resistance protein RGA2-like [Quercus suber]
MAESIVSSLLEQFASITFQEAEQEIRLVIGVDEEVRKLEGNLRTIQAVLDDAEKRQLKEEAVKLWLKRLKDVSYEMDDVLDEWNTAMIKSEIEKQEKSESSPILKKAMLMMKGLMGRCLSHETTLDRLREKAKATDDELTQLRAWKAVQEKKLKMAEGVRDEYFKKTKELSKVLEDKEKEICQAKVDAVREYRDSNDLLLEPGSSFNDGFDDAFRQVKSLYPDLDLSSVNISVPEQTSV